MLHLCADFATRRVFKHIVPPRTTFFYMTSEWTPMELVMFGAAVSLRLDVKDCHFMVRTRTLEEVYQAYLWVYSGGHTNVTDAALIKRWRDGEPLSSMDQVRLDGLRWTHVELTD